jgi:hypothetical protein
MSEHREANTFALPPGHDQYGTPTHFREALNAVFRFDDYDPCPVNPAGLRTVDGRGQTPAWVKRYFYNPPYSDVVPWLNMSIADFRRGVSSFVLLKADTSTEWFHDQVVPYARPIWVRGRLSFPYRDKKSGETKVAPAPFNSFVAAYEPGKPLLPQSVMWRDPGVRIRELKPENWHILNRPMEDIKLT